MKKNNVWLMSLVLFFAISASNAVISMEEELPKKESPKLLPEIQKIIANKALRVILDAAEYELDLQKAVPIDINKAILLIQNGANPNTKSYKGNTIVHLLIKGLSDKIYGWETYDKYGERVSEIDRPSKADLEEFNIYLNKLKVLFKQLDGFKMNLNAKMNNGVTAAFELIDLVFTPHTYNYPQTFFDNMWNFIFWLQQLGMDFTTVKAEVTSVYGQTDTFTACEYGQYYITEQGGPDYIREPGSEEKYEEAKLKKLCSFK